MGLLWGRGGESQQSEKIAALEKAVEALDTGVRGLDGAVETLERDSKKIRLEWEDVYDRVTRTMGRLNARIRKSEGISATESDVEPVAQAPAPPTVSGTHAQLSAMRGRRGLLPG